MGNQRDDPDRKLFGNLIRKLREQRGLSRDQLGAEIGHTGSTIGNIESGYRAPTPEQAKSLDRAFGLPAVLEELENRLHGMPFSAGFRPFAPYEAEATVIHVFETTIIPGLLQTADYARAILATHPNVTPELVEERLNARLERQKILQRDQPPQLWVLLDEMVLHREIGGPKIMTDQLRHLAHSAGQPGITVQILATRTHSGVTGSFNIAETPGRRVGYVENVLDGTTAEDAATVSELELRLGTLRTESLRGSESLALIERVLDESERRS